MMEQIFEIKPLDVLFFRDGFPFSRGENYFARSIFPPNLSTIYGALRTMILDYKKIDLKEWLENRQTNSLIGTKDNYGSLEITDFAIKVENKLIYIPPIDLKLTKKDEIIKLNIKKVNISEFSNLNNIKLDIIFHTDKKFKEKKYFIGDKGLIKYLNNEEIKFNSEYIIQHLIIKDKRLGIKIDRHSQNVKEGLLYNIEYNKFIDENSSFIIKIKTDETLNLDNFIFRLGGDTKIAVIKKLNNNFNLPDFYKIQSNTNYFYLILKTPGIFPENKFYPDCFKKNNSNELVYENNNTKIKLIGMYIDKPKVISGFDIANKKQKEIYKAVPEGSIYVCEILSGNIENIKNDLYPKIKVNNDKIMKEGYNLTFIKGGNIQ